MRCESYGCDMDATRIHSSKPFAESTSNDFCNPPFADQTTGLVTHVVLEIVDVLIVPDPLAFEGAWSKPSD